MISSEKIKKEMLYKRDEMFQLINMNEGMGFTKCYYLISKIDLSVWKGEQMENPYIYFSRECAGNVVRD